MITNFNIEFDGAAFEFVTMNRVRLHLYQVYVDHEGKQKRFHMQLNKEGAFSIVDKIACPEVYLPLESTFSDAILKLGTKV
jgi:hypothetical protein